MHRVAGLEGLTATMNISSRCISTILPVLVPTETGGFLLPTLPSNISPLILCRVRRSPFWQCIMGNRGFSIRNTVSPCLRIYYALSNPEKWLVLMVGISFWEVWFLKNRNTSTLDLLLRKVVGILMLAL